MKYYLKAKVIINDSSVYPLIMNFMFRQNMTFQ